MPKLMAMNSFRATQRCLSGHYKFEVRLRDSNDVSWAHIAKYRCEG